VCYKSPAAKSPAATNHQAICSLQFELDVKTMAWLANEISDKVKYRLRMKGGDFILRISFQIKNTFRDDTSSNRYDKCEKERVSNLWLDTRRMCILLNRIAA
jgi:hypothetical protein